MKERIAKEIKKLTSEIPGAFFFYDLDSFEEQLSQMRAFDGLKLWYATKANPLSSVIKSVSKFPINFDCASHGEVNQVLSQRVHSSRLLTTGPAKSKKFFRICLKQGINTFIIESINQLHWLEEVASEFNVRPEVLIRMQLEWDMELDNVLGGNKLTPFGLTLSDWKKVDLKIFSHFDVIGVHSFQWGNILDINLLQTIWNYCAQKAQELAQLLDFELKVLDVGGGLGIVYHPEQRPLEWTQVASSLEKIKESYKLNEIWMELGRYMIGPYGHYVSQIYDIKEVAGEKLVILDSGINHLIRPLLAEESFPMQVLEERSQETSSFTLHGPLCTSLDKLGQCELPQDIQVGDHIVFHQCGAYGFTESMPFFLCHELPAEIVYKNQKTEIVRQIEQPTMWLR